MSATAIASVSQEVTSDLADKLLYYMLMMRELEDRIELKLYRQGKIVGGCYTGRGQEAIPSGSAVLSRPDDYLCPSHRDMAAFLIRGMTPREVLAQYLGRVTGPTGGRDGNMHMGCARRHLLPIISSIGASIPVANGIALAMKYRGEPNVVFNYWGDGATSRGDWHEGLNFATVQKLPIVYLCNNNLYAYSTPLEKQMVVKNVADRASAYGMPAEIVDGNDVFAIFDASRRAVAHARNGLGPYLIECKTFRVSGHSAHDAADYVPQHVREEWSKKDPILRLQKDMVERGWATEQDFRQVRQGVLEEIDDAVNWALEQPFPDPATLEEGVYEVI
ncbi:MAG: thiamine pyrophosphate-dependent dehydrogenase E1 component subunit alpha [Bryobacterales bacterium]|nr:thiamine pyrophosphate-dependent dehydrogenase E1 component subunit alpha [Bryobacterales bacterium]MDE0294858.1 thiamine pyrophosphate-dependent dehydrogenase E1 component subunit alpha [Bryobacterales bacterium]